MARLTPDQINVSHAWLNDIFVWGGLIPVSNSRRSVDVNDYRYMYRRNNTNSGKDSSKVLCDMLKNRTVDYKKFQDCDNALNDLSGYKFDPDLHSTTYYVPGVRKKPEMLARYLANFMAERKYYLDDSNASTYEMDEIKNTILGNALWEYGCFLSQTNKPKPMTATRVSAPKQPGQAPQNGYKASGAQSGNVKCLVGQPNNKLAASAPISYCIEADKIGKNTPNAFIKPLDAKACPNGEAVVYFGSGNGYTDCKCWFDDINNANAFLTNCMNKFGQKFTNFHISKAKSDANGYYICHTEFGDCGIKASKLNEQLKAEDIKEEIQKELVGNFDVYEEGYYKEL